MTLSTEQIDISTEPESLLERLQDNMRLYDELLARIADSEQSLEDAIAGLEAVDLEKAYEQGDKNIALAVLSKVIIERKLEALQIDQEEASYISTFDLEPKLWAQREHYRLRALHPQKAKVGVFLVNNMNHTPGTPLRGGYTLLREVVSHVGLINRMNLTSSDGGSIQLKSPNGKEAYMAGPIYDRENDYQPLFELKLHGRD